ncbi:MAG TPA: hypothetical protein VHM19_23160 [Polyangiales bacterium]|jgi:hypothetical protein|nr:hypothetical protein [Polyangiales bacterium]
MTPRTRQRIERTLELLQARGPLDVDAVTAALEPYAGSSRRLLRRKADVVLLLLRRMERAGLVQCERVTISGGKRLLRFSRATPASNGFGQQSGPGGSPCLAQLSSVESRP